MGDWRRHAIYFAPPRGSALARFGADWLGWDPETGAERDGFALPGLPRSRAALTDAPRGYGLHATLKAPFRLAEGRDVGELDAAAAALAESFVPFEVPRLRIGALGGFLALVPGAGEAEVGRLADACVMRLDGFRAPPEAVEQERRRGGGLDAVEAAHLRRWGYPYVLDRFRFHMTLTGMLAPEDHSSVRAVLETALAPMLEEALPVAEICRFGEGADGRFHLVRRYRLGRSAGGGG